MPGDRLYDTGDGRRHPFQHLDRVRPSTITIVYDQHERELTERLTSIQHDHHHALLAATRIHLDHDSCSR